MSKKKIELKEIKRWWDFKRQLRWQNIYNKKNYTSLALNNRMEMILYYMNKLRLKKIFYIGKKTVRCKKTQAG